MNIGVIGAGGVGGYIGCRLAAAESIDDANRIFLVARGPHLKAIRADGLILESSEGRSVCRPALATDRISELPELDVCFITVKAYELDNVCTELNSKIRSDTLIIPLLNGADIAERIRKIIPDGIILPACIYIIAFIEKPGTVVQRIERPLIHLGSENGESSALQSGAGKLLQLFDRAGIRCRWHDDPRTEIWRKFLFIASFSLVTAARDMSIGEVMSSADASSEVAAVMDEIFRIATARGVTLDPDVCEKALSLGSKMDPDATTSFQRDFGTEGKPDEREIFGAAVLEMGRESGLSTENTASVYRCLQRKKPFPE